MKRWWDIFSKYLRVIIWLFYTVKDFNISYCWWKLLCLNEKKNVTRICKCTEILWIVNSTPFFQRLTNVSRSNSKSWQEGNIEKLFFFFSSSLNLNVFLFVQGWCRYIFIMIRLCLIKLVWCSSSQLGYNNKERLFWLKRNPHFNTRD